VTSTTGPRSAHVVRRPCVAPAMAAALSQAVARPSMTWDAAARAARSAAAWARCLAARIPPADIATTATSQTRAISATTHTVPDPRSAPNAPGPPHRRAPAPTRPRLCLFGQAPSLPFPDHRPPAPPPLPGQRSVMTPSPPCVIGRNSAPRHNRPCQALPCHGRSPPFALPNRPPRAPSPVPPLPGRGVFAPGSVAATARSWMTTGGSPLNAGARISTFTSTSVRSPSRRVVTRAPDGAPRATAVSTAGIGSPRAAARAPARAASTQAT
jgi:hypothetical protein